MVYIHIPEKSIQTAFAKYEHWPLAKPKPVKARLENTVEGVCPYCKQPMSTSEAAGVPVWVCHSDRAVSPKLNSTEPELDLTFSLSPVLNTNL